MGKKGGAKVGKNRSKNLSKEKKKGEAGIAAQYITRNKAIKKLQITLKDFRRLCILKGIYPRDPKKKKEGKAKTYYHVKDILFLAHEPLLHHFRELKIYLRKHKKAFGKKNWKELDSIKDNKPFHSLNHLIKERYPSFADSLRDLDDCLCMVSLFAMLPSGAIRSLTSERTERCQRLVKEFHLLTARTNSLRKCFVSIKGIYYQAELSGETVTWLVPHQFTQCMPDDVDYRVMSTFLEFYETLLTFVNFKLFHNAGMAYPPRLDVASETSGAGLGSLQVETIEEAAKRKQAEEKQAQLQQKTVRTVDHAKLQEIKAASDAADDTEMVDDDEQDADDQETGFEQHQQAGLGDDEANADDRSRLFAGLKFYLNREVPQDTIEFVLLACGAAVVRSDADNADDVSSTSITHHVVDRPLPNAKRIAGREYIQPQWILDGVNCNSLLPIGPYKPGVSPPAHLSPFVTASGNDYVPRQQKVLDAWKQGLPGDDVSESDSDDDDQPDQEDDETRHHRELQLERAGTKRKRNQASDSENDLDSDMEAALEDAAPAAKPKGKGKKKKQKKSSAADEEAKKMAEIVMSKRHKRLKSRMDYGNQIKQDKIDTLKSKRRKLDKVAKQQQGRR